MRKLTHREIVERQAGKAESPRLPFVVVLNNIRSLYNVGSIFRSADGAGVSHLYLCGITGYPPNAQIAKTALGAQDQVPWSYRQDAQSVLSELKEKGFELLLLEQTDTSQAYQDFTPRSPVALVLGHEIEGVSPAIISQCDRALEIEMEGRKNSLNVAVAFGIVAFHIRNSIMSESSFKR